MARLACGSGRYVRICPRCSAAGHDHDLRHAVETASGDPVGVAGCARLCQSHVAKQSPTKGRQIADGCRYASTRTHVAAFATQSTCVNMVCHGTRRLDWPQSCSGRIQGCIGRAVALHAVGRCRLNVLVNYPNQGRCAKTGVAGSAGGRGLIGNVIGRRNTGVKGCHTVAQRAVARVWVQVIAHKELAGAGRRGVLRPPLEACKRCSGRDGIFVHPHPNTTSIVAAATAGSHTRVDHRRCRRRVAETSGTQCGRSIGGNKPGGHTSHMAAFARGSRRNVRSGAS